MLDELKEKGLKGMVLFLQEKIREKMKNTNIKSMSHRRSSFEYRFKEIVLNMTKGPHEKNALMRINIYNCHGMHTSKSNDFYEIKFGIQNFEIDNPKIDTGEKNRVLKRMDSSTGG